jgi:hypothetical protein
LRRPLREGRPCGFKAVRVAASRDGPVCYIDAMILKGLAIFAVLTTLAAMPASLSAQATHPATAPTTSHPATPLKTLSPYPAPAPAQAQPRPDCNGVPCEDQQPRVIVTLPAPTPTPWPIHDRILWGAYLVLAFVAYAGVHFLRRIEQNTRAIEAIAGAAQETASATLAAATAASATAQSALLHAQAIVNAERPWVLVTAEPTRGVESSFDITATNRGRSPATITSAMDEPLFAADEEHLPGVPELKKFESAARFVPVILLPGESATLKTFSREDVKSLCASDEKFAAIESWSERLFLCGKVEYNDLIAAAGRETHETRWCCWYIHGKQRSALVPAGPSEYNSHT